jgi:hypothetical protein
MNSDQFKAMADNIEKLLALRARQAELLTIMLKMARRAQTGEGAAVNWFKHNKEGEQ